MSEQIRTATQADVAAMTTMATIRREQYAQYQPLFWRPAADAQDKHRPHLASLVASDEVISLVSEEAGHLTGFLIATAGPAPTGLSTSYSTASSRQPSTPPTEAVSDVRAARADQQARATLT